MFGGSHFSVGGVAGFCMSCISTSSWSRLRRKNKQLRPWGPDCKSLFCRLVLIAISVVVQVVKNERIFIPVGPQNMRSPLTLLIGHLGAYTVRILYEHDRERLLLRLIRTRGDMTHHDATHDHMAAVRVMTTEAVEARPTACHNPPQFSTRL